MTNTIFTIDNNTFEISTSASTVLPGLCGSPSTESFPACVTTGIGSFPFRIVAGGSLFGMDLGSLPSALQLMVREQLTDDLLNQVLYK